MALWAVIWGVADSLFLTCHCFNQVLLLEIFPPSSSLLMPQRNIFGDKTEKSNSSESLLYFFLSKRTQLSPWSSIYINFFLKFHVFVYESIGTTCRSCFFLFTKWVPGVELRLLALITMPLPVGSSCQPPI